MYCMESEGTFMVDWFMFLKYATKTFNMLLILIKPRPATIFILYLTHRIQTKLQVPTCAQQLSVHDLEH